MWYLILAQLRDISRFLHHYSMTIHPEYIHLIVTGAGCGHFGIITVV